jgi:hypothetical protein
MDEQPEMKNAGRLQLPEQDVRRFNEAIQAFGFEKPSIFLRRCAYAIIRRHESGEELATPLDFKTVRHSNSNPFETPGSPDPAEGL